MAFSVVYELQMPKITWRDAYRLINPRIDAAGAHIWPFDRAFPVEAQFWTYDRARDIRMNRHAYFEIILVDQGQAVFQVQDRFLKIEQGDLFIVGSHLFHRLIYRGVPLASPRIMFLPEVIAASHLHHGDADYLLPFQVQDSKFPHIVRASTGVPARVREHLVAMASYLPARTMSARLFAKTHLKMILAILVEHYASYAGKRSASQIRQSDLKRMQCVFEYIDANYAEAVSLEDAAGLVPMSPRSFTRFFKKVTGQTFVTYLNSFRVEKARQLLSDGGRTITDVCYEVGFSSQSYFGAVFRKLVHMSPSEYATQVRRPK